MKPTLPLLTRREVADLCQISLSFLNRAATHNDGPPVIRIGRSVRYERAAVERWLEGLGSQA